MANRENGIEVILHKNTWGMEMEECWVGSGGAEIAELLKIT